MNEMYLVNPWKKTYTPHSGQPIICSTFASQFLYITSIVSHPTACPMIQRVYTDRRSGS